MQSLEDNSEPENTSFIKEFIKD